MQSTTVILKTKYTRKNVNGTESFTQYTISVNGGYPAKDGKNINFPKGTTLAQIKKLYPEFADAQVVVMPSETLRGDRRAKCEDLKVATVLEYGKADAAFKVMPATPEEVAEDFATEPSDAIYTLNRERPKC